MKISSSSWARVLVGTGVAAALLATAPTSHAVAEKTWWLKVATGRSSGAGTDATVKAQVLCTDGTLTSQENLDKPYYNDFEQGTEETYGKGVPEGCQPQSVEFDLVGGSEFDGGSWEFRKVTLIAPSGKEYFGGEGSSGQTGRWLSADTINSSRHAHVVLRDTY